jgi:hypothetical protein
MLSQQSTTCYFRFKQVHTLKKNLFIVFCMISLQYGSSHLKQILSPFHVFIPNKFILWLTLSFNACNAEEVLHVLLPNRLYWPHQSFCRYPRPNPNSTQTLKLNPNLPRCQTLAAGLAGSPDMQYHELICGIKT